MFSLILFLSLSISSNTNESEWISKRYKNIATLRAYDYYVYNGYS